MEYYHPMIGIRERCKRSKHNGNQNPNAYMFVQLRNIMPKSGMAWLHSDRVMYHQRRDQRVALALWNAGYALSTTGLTRALTPMFQIAQRTFIDARTHTEAENSLWDMLPKVQKQLDWARQLPDAVFFELFTCIIEARYSWEKRPTYPFFDYNEYNALVRELVHFRKVVGDCPQDDSFVVSDYVSWILVDAKFYNNLANGLDEDDIFTESEGGSDADNYGTVDALNMYTYEKENEDVMMGGTDERGDLIPPIGQLTLECPEAQQQKDVNYSDTSVEIDIE